MKTTTLTGNQWYYTTLERINTAFDLTTVKHFIAIAEAIDRGEYEASLKSSGEMVLRKHYQQRKQKHKD